MAGMPGRRAGMLEIQVRCERCDGLLTATTCDEEIMIEPCEVCLETTREAAYDDGHTFGYSEGYTARDKEDE